MYHTVSLLSELPTQSPAKPIVPLVLALVLGLALTYPGSLRAYPVTDAPGTGQPAGEQSTGSATVPHRQSVRTVSIDIQQLSFDRKIISVTAGETIRFVIRNRGDRPHDFTLGTPQVQKARRVQLILGLVEAKLQKQNTLPVSWPDAPTAVVVTPGETKEILWQFNRSRDVEFGCNIPLHYEPEMKGIVSIEADIHQENVVASSNRQPPQTAVLPRKEPMRTSASGSGDATLKKPGAPPVRPPSLRRTDVPSIKHSRKKRRMVRGQVKTSVNYNVAANDDEYDYDDPGSRNSHRTGRQSALSAWALGGSGAKGEGSD